MNGFGGDIQQKVARRTVALLHELGATAPVLLESTITDLAVRSEDVLLRVNAEFFPHGNGLKETALTETNTVEELILEIIHNLPQGRQKS